MRVRATILLVLVLLTTGCGSKWFHTAVIVDSAMYEALSTVHTLEQQALCGLPSCASVCKPDANKVMQCSVPPRHPDWNAQKSQQFNVQFLPVVEGGRQFNTLLSQWNPDGPMPPEMVIMIRDLADSLVMIAQSFPAGSSKETMLARIASVQSTVLTAIATVLGGRNE